MWSFSHTSHWSSPQPFGTHTGKGWAVCNDHLEPTNEACTVELHTEEGSWKLPKHLNSWTFPGYCEPRTACVTCLASHSDLFMRIAIHSHTQNTHYLFTLLGLFPTPTSLHIYFLPPPYSPTQCPLPALSTHRSCPAFVIYWWGGPLDWGQHACLALYICHQSNRLE